MVRSEHYTRQKFNLYLESFHNALDVASFNRAIRCVCDCVEEIAMRVRDPLPHAIANGIIDGAPVVVPILADHDEDESSSNEENLAQWSKAMRFLLVNLKFLQVKLTKKQ